MLNATILCVLIRGGAERRGSSRRKADGELQKCSSGFQQQHQINTEVAETQPSSAEMPTDPKSSFGPTSWQSSNLRGFLVPPQAQSLELPSAPSLFYVTFLLDTRPSGTRWQQLTSTLVFAELPPWPGWAGGERHRSTEQWRLEKPSESLESKP